MLVVKGLVKSGMTVCATIHSPTPFSFNLFDYMMILLGGRVIYCGRNGESLNESLISAKERIFFVSRRP